MALIDEAAEREIFSELVMPALFRLRRRPAQPGALAAAEPEGWLGWPVAAIHDLNCALNQRRGWRRALSCAETKICVLAP
jgi:hypothetical protein